MLELFAGSAGCSRKDPLRLPELLANQVTYIVLSSSTLSPSVLYLSPVLDASRRTGSPQQESLGSSSLLPSGVNAIPQILGVGRGRREMKTNKRWWVE